jgi:hypothetical protein
VYIYSVLNEIVGKKIRIEEWERREHIKLSQNLLVDNVHPCILSVVHPSCCDTRCETCRELIAGILVQEKLKSRAGKRKECIRSNRCWWVGGWMDGWMDGWRRSE